MGDKETFANELDRMLYPSIEAICDAADTAPGHEKNEDRFRTTFEKNGKTISVEMGWDQYTERKVTCDGTVVYWRTDQHSEEDLRTEILRPGDWVYPVLELGQMVRNADERDVITKAVERALQKQEAFKPV